MTDAVVEALRERADAGGPEERRALAAALCAGAGGGDCPLLRQVDAR